MTETHDRLSVAECDVLDEALVAHVDGVNGVVSAVGTARVQDPDSSLYARAAESLVSALRGLGDVAPRRSYSIMRFVAYPALCVSISSTRYESR